MNEEPRSVMAMEIATRMLAEIASVDDALTLIDHAELARVMARQSKLGTRAINHATVIKVRAERKLADLVDEGQQAGVIAEPGRPENVRSANLFADIGVDKVRLHEARLLRDTYTDEALEARQAEADDRDEVLSRQQLLAEARAENNRNAEIQKQRVALLYPVYEALEALASVDMPASEWAARVPSYATGNVSNHLDAAFDWLSGLKESWHEHKNFTK